MNYLSVCSGIEAASVAWHPLGFRPVAFSEIEAFPSAVLAHHWPEAPNLGDMTKFKTWPKYDSISLLVGGTPCQSFSVAGLREGLADPRGNLTLTYLAIAAQYRPKWICWENVPGVLSDATGAFGALLGGLSKLGYGWAYRILDAQYAGVPQRRRRVFLVGSLGGWQRAAQVLFERHSLQGHSAPSRQEGKGVAPTLSARTKGGGGLGTDFDLDGGLVCAGTLAASGAGTSRPAGQCNELDFLVAGTIQATGMTAVNQHDAESGMYIAHSLRGEGFDASEDGTGRGIPLVPMEMNVRRLTPRECERLQGFADDYTLIPYKRKPAADGPRYKALGNSMAVPVMRWIGQRIQMVENL